MWLTTITYDLVAIRALGPEAAVLSQSLSDKKEELKTIDGHGVSVPGFLAPDSPGDIEPSANTLVVKRLWNTESAAQELVDFANTASEHIIATIQEQV